MYVQRLDIASIDGKTNEIFVWVSRVKVNGKIGIFFKLFQKLILRFLYTDIQQRVTIIQRTIRPGREQKAYGTD